MKKDDLKEMMRQTLQKGESLVEVEMKEVEDFMNSAEVVVGNQVKGDSKSWIAMMDQEIHRLQAQNEGTTLRNVIFIVKSKDCAISMNEMEQVCDTLDKSMKLQEAIWGLMRDESMNENEVEVTFLLGE